MSDSDEQNRFHNKSIAAEPGEGPSLTLIYSLIAVALLAAIGIALFIVLPCYHRL
jgi:hypothetical protein